MIVGFNIDSLSGSREDDVIGDLQIQYNPVIDQIEEAEVSALDDPVARINFTFTVNYNADGDAAATIELTGNVLWKGDVDSIIESWEDDETLPEGMEAPFMNDLYRKCISQAVGIADTLNLLPPIPTPRVE